MAITLVKDGGQYTSSAHKEFIVDSASDISNLDGLSTCAPGSYATIIGGDRYVLTSSGTWVKHNESYEIGTVSAEGVTYDETLESHASGSVGEYLSDILARIAALEEKASD